MRKVGALPKSLSLNSVHSLNLVTKFQPAIFCESRNEPTEQEDTGNRVLLHLLNSLKVLLQLRKTPLEMTVNVILQ